MNNSGIGFADYSEKCDNTALFQTRARRAHFFQSNKATFLLTASKGARRIGVFQGNFGQYYG